MTPPQAALNIDPVSEFRQALESAGLLPGEVSPDGILKRCGTADHPKSTNGAFKMFEDGRGGWFENHADGRGVQFWTAAGCEPLTPGERAAFRAEVEKAKAEREKTQAEARAAAITAARGYLDGLPPATDANAYLIKKKVHAVSGLLADGADLIVPVLGADGRPMSYQRIDADGGKRFAPGAAVAGGFFAIGPKGCDLPLCIAEGISTSLSIYESTGFPCLTAFSAGNLEAVAQMARSRYPERQIIMAADNDAGTEARTGRNPGLDAAKAAALAVAGLLAIPESGGDFNDIHAAQGVDAVKALIDAAGPAEKIETTAAADTWPEPLPLPDGLPPVADFVFDLLPGTLRGWAADITERMQCPGDYTGAAIMAALGSIIGRRVG
ncbi:MAG: toprim domain-containing protein, partial [Desulfobacterales bacterium]